MGTSGFEICRQRHTRLARCLAAALVLACGSVNAAGQRPGWWKRPDPSDIALRWQPAPHALPDIPAGSIVVQNCNDHGSGSLRQALANASSGDTIDLTQICRSPAIDAGNNTFGASYDQRGSGYPRVIGSAADIGAYELDTDVIFANGFDP